MILELHVPEGHDAAALRGLVPELLTYLLSFVYLGIYWSNHHHLFHACQRVNGAILWANLHLLFWLSLVPFTTAWMERTHLAALPTAAYGFVLLMAAVSWTIMLVPLKRVHGSEALITRATGGWKENVSLALYLVGIGLAFVHGGLAAACYVIVAVLWLVPDRRIESRLNAAG